MGRPPQHTLLRQDVIDCALSGWSISETAEELDVKYHAVYRFAKQEEILHLFRHGNRVMQKLQKSSIDRGPIRA